MTVLFPPFQFGCLSFLFLVWSLWVELPILCWIEVLRVDNLVLFLILVGKISVFPIEYDVGCRSLIYGLYYVEEWSLCSHFAECFYHKMLLYLIKCFLPIYLYDHVIFVFCFVFCEVYRIFYVHCHVICKQWQFCFLLYSLDTSYFFFLSDCCG